MPYVLWFAFWFVGMSFVEWYAHRHVMHKKGWLYRWFPDVQHRHAVLHHRTYYKEFNHEPDEHGRHINIEFELLPSLPLALLLAAIVCSLSVPSALMALAAVLAHHLIWNVVHSEMHIPKGRFFSRWRIYKFLACYHLQHHRYPGKNYNVVVPLADFLFGTYIKPSEKDLVKMRQYGYRD